MKYDKIEPGNRYGKLVAVAKNMHRKYQGYLAFWDFICDCGATYTCRTDMVKRGRTKSCGCIYNRGKAILTVRHGLSNNPEYRVWAGIKSRCYNARSQAYAYYGAKGIAMSNEWLTSFDAFYKDMGPRPSPSHSIDRVDNTKGYSAENCRWATKREQDSNRSSNVKYTYNGETKTATEWANGLGIKWGASFSSRVKKYGLEKAITTPRRSWPLPKQ